uniref:Uncharacterized protein n=1 Tax=Craspedostauros australis TaxID=1486917 RepID=A0A7R9ZNK5_9STRA|mmetsp:Transcript_21440/g.59647  ORF Transcript_21440/g.59647 Transcript_21440/m.59647 type:complete len:264 (+) Transcript_21440:181-972(+)|eukprot:CAMPEP_0198109474 /NCGR_PEP_ID=MMETSP1442-20131203/1518_1 /TAXON_ID= /ORGANISM="Craspedostauros australis, Strain CCMP3328" /LENGTH=263 /DNA_ID=CAMNT_0043765145 /DNA_START=130 /DNA_END=921 /DNA_ORIENTATION=-
MNREEHMENGVVSGSASDTMPSNNNDSNNNDSDNNDSDNNNNNQRAPRHSPTKVLLAEQRRQRQFPNAITNATATTNTTSTPSTMMNSSGPNSHPQHQNQHQPPRDAATIAMQTIVLAEAQQNDVELQANTQRSHNSNSNDNSSRSNSHSNGDDNAEYMHTKTTPAPIDADIYNSHVEPHAFFTKPVDGINDSAFDVNVSVSNTNVTSDSLSNQQKQTHGSRAAWRFVVVSALLMFIAAVVTTLILVAEKTEDNDLDEDEASP